VNKLTKYLPCADIDSTPSAKLLYLMLLDITDEDNSVVISQKKISEVLGISKSTVRKNMRRLERGGHIKIVAQWSRFGGRDPNQFVVLGDAV